MVAVIEKSFWQKFHSFKGKYYATDWFFSFNIYTNIKVKLLKELIVWDISLFILTCSNIKYIRKYVRKNIDAI